jgi:glycosyltransferase involved in cell wall biosynthesis
MRILHLDAGSEMRGGQWQVLRLVEGLHREGVAYTLLARHGSPLFEMAHRARLRVEPLAWRRALALGRAHDLVHAHDARSHTIGLLVSGTPLVVSRRVAFPLRSRWKYGRARHFIAVSEFVKSVLLAGGVPEEKISVVYDGVPLLNPASGTAVLAPPNALEPQKGASLASEAARLAGIRLELSSTLESDLQRAGLFLYITQSEGLGSAALLAMSAAVPVIASNVGGLREVIHHRENGILVENSIEAIAAALRELNQNPDLSRRLGQAARQTVAEKFTTALMVRRTMEVYRQVLA